MTMMLGFPAGLGASAAFSAASGTASNREQILRDGVIGVIKSGEL
jgi:hypothetical protein